ncbi:methionyl-tRNA formyltransferase [candidate division KSB1 bacterium 4484_87]|nr:MAG: methionyl-tRNA formyltransferase [candidate division KSB1 bacterium 4484_87]
MKLIFMGTPDFAVPSLVKLHQSNHQIVAVVTGPDKAVGRGQKIRETPVKLKARELGIPMLTPEKLSDASFVEQLQRYGADLFVVVAFRILPASVFTIPPKGTINLHASLLPKYRGAAPINWAIINGEKETGVTTFFIEEKVDTGEWIFQRPVPIGDNETAGDLHDKLSQIGAEVLLETVSAIDKGNAPRIKQIGEATRAPKITRKICHLNWAQDARTVFNYVRGLSPYPRAFSIHKGQELKILKAEIQSGEKKTNVEPGLVIEVMKDRFIVACDEGSLAITGVQPPNRRPMSAAEYLRGYPLAEGEILQ